MSFILPLVLQSGWMTEDGRMLVCQSCLLVCLSFRGQIECLEPPLHDLLRLALLYLYPVFESNHRLWMFTNAAAATHAHVTMQILRVEHLSAQEIQWNLQ